TQSDQCGLRHEEARLQEQLWAEEEEYRYKRMQTTELQKDIQGMNRTMEMLAQEEKVGARADERESVTLSSAEEGNGLFPERGKIVRATKQV
ncbi:hypothetical protein NHX12_016539, partial [Muraenolepis orangiensis]